MKHTMLLLPLGFAFLLCGCATTGYQHASEVRSAIGEARAVMVNMQRELDATATAVQNLASNDVTNLQAPYQVFSRAVDDLSNQLEKLSPRIQSIRERGDSYVQAWQEDLGSYQSLDIRANSAARRNEVLESFRKLNTELQAAEASLHPVLMSLKDMQLYLSTDLTASGVTSIQQQFGRISTQIADAQQRLQSLVADLDRVSTELSPVKPATEEPPPTK